MHADTIEMAEELHHHESIHKILRKNIWSAILDLQSNLTSCSEIT